MKPTPISHEQWIEEINRRDRYTVVIDITLTETGRQRRERMMRETLEQVELLRQAHAFTK